MSPITIQLSEEGLRKLQDLAKQADTTPEELLRANVEEWLTRPARDFAEAADYVLRKNAELYRRLA